MLQSLLADRFGLIAHKEKRDGQVYALTLARPDGKLGPQLSRSAVDCTALARAGGPPPQGACSMRVGNGTLAARSVTMSDIARVLMGSVDRIVVDRTGLEGAYDVDLAWTPNPTPDSPGASIFTALQEQLGLKLEAARAPVDVVVIDRIE